MTVSQAIAQAEALTGQVFSRDVLIRWLSELDGQIAFDIFWMNTWRPYIDGDDGTGEEAVDRTLLVLHPWDGGVYTHYLEAMTYFSNGEYDRYANARTMHEEALGEFKRTVQRTKNCCGCITMKYGGTVVDGVVVPGGSGDEIILREEGCTC